MKSTKWTNVINNKNPQTSFDNLFNVINYARDIAFPEKKFKQKAKRFVHSPWITKGLIISHKGKEKLFAKKGEIHQTFTSKTLYYMINNKLRCAAKITYFDNQFPKCSNKHGAPRDAVLPSGFRVPLDITHPSGVEAVWRFSVSVPIAKDDIIWIAGQGDSLVFDSRELLELYLEKLSDL